MKKFEVYIESQFGVSSHDVGKVAALFKEETLEKGDFFVKVGRYAEKLSFIQSGLIRIYGTVKDKDVTQWIATENSFVVDLYSFISRSEARWNMQALTECKLYSISRNDYGQLEKVVPNWVELEKLFITRCFAFMEDRVFSHLSLTAEERYNQLFRLRPELFNQVQQQYIATMLGMTPETFSRLKKTIS